MDEIYKKCQFTLEVLVIILLVFLFWLLSQLGFFVITFLLLLLYPFKDTVLVQQDDII